MSINFLAGIFTFGAFVVSGVYGSVGISGLPPQVRERRHTSSPNMETVPLLQEDTILVDHSINASTPDLAVQVRC